MCEITEPTGAQRGWLTGVVLRGRWSERDSMRFAFLLLPLLISCSKPPTSMEVCKKLEAAGQASNCVQGTPGGLGAGAREKVDFDLPSVPGHKGQIMAFDRDDMYEQTVKSYLQTVLLAGKHQYGNPKKRIFAQLNKGLSNENGDKVRDIINDLLRSDGQRVNASRAVHRHRRPVGSPQPKLEGQARHPAAHCHASHQMQRHAQARRERGLRDKPGM